MSKREGYKAGLGNTRRKSNSIPANRCRMRKRASRSLPSGTITTAQRSVERARASADLQCGSTRLWRRDPIPSVSAQTFSIFQNMRSRSDPKAACWSRSSSTQRSVGCTNYWKSKRRKPAECEQSCSRPASLVSAPTLPRASFTRPFTTPACA